MTNLNDLITALEAGNYDEVLKGTKYHEPRDYGYDVCNEAHRSLVEDSRINAARCIVLEAAVRELRAHMDSLLRASKYDRLDIPRDRITGLLADAETNGWKIFDATKKLVGGGE